MCAVYVLLLRRSLCFSLFSLIISSFHHFAFFAPSNWILMPPYGIFRYISFFFPNQIVQRIVQVVLNIKRVNIGCAKRSAVLFSLLVLLLFSPDGKWQTGRLSREHVCVSVCLCVQKSKWEKCQCLAASISFFTKVNQCSKKLPFAYFTSCFNHDSTCRC